MWFVESEDVSEISSFDARHFKRVIEEKNAELCNALTRSRLFRV